MHELYMAKYESDGNHVVSYEYYRQYFNDNFNLSFGHPKSDTCGTCDQFKLQIEAANEREKQVLLSQREEHQLEAENFYSSLPTNTILAKQNSHIATITFDFQQNLPLPHIPIGDVFYMHQLWLYVFGVHNCGTNQAVMYSWSQDMVKGFGEHLAPLFKKSVTVRKRPFSVQRARILDYSSEHPTQLWVKYSTEDES